MRPADLLTEENAVRLDSRLYASIVESSADVIISESLGGIIRSWNVAAEQMFGYTAEQAVGRHNSLLIPADRADEEDRNIERLQAGERIEPYDTVQVRSDGQHVAASLTLSPVEDAQGRVVMASKIVRNTRGRRDAEEHLRASEEFNRSLMDATPNCVKVLHCTGECCI